MRHSSLSIKASLSYGQALLVEKSFIMTVIFPQFVNFAQEKNKLAYRQENKKCWIP